MKNNISSKEKEKRKELYQKMNGDRSNCDIKFSFPEKNCDIKCNWQDYLLRKR